MVWSGAGGGSQKSVPEISDFYDIYAHYTVYVTSQK